MKLIKNALIFLLVVDIFALTACSSDDDSQEVPGGIVGVWRVSSLNFSATTPEGQNLTGEVINLGEINATANFKENGDFESNTDGGYVLRITLDGFPITQNIDPWITNGTWIKNDNTLTITDDTGSSSFNIHSLTSSEMVLKTNEVPGNIPGDDEFTNVDYTMVLTK